MTNIFIKYVWYNKVLSNVPIGYNYLWLCSAGYALNGTKLCKHKWHNLFLPKSNKQQGQILLSIYIFDENELDKKKLRKKIKDIEYIPETQLYNCEICVLGLRELKPLGLLLLKNRLLNLI